MSGCLDRVQCDCECCDPVKEWLGEKRNNLASIVAGTLFAMGWWFVIDSCALYSEAIYGAYFICGIVSTIALIMINSISTGQITGDAYTEGCMGKKGARAWLFFGFLFAFMGLIGSLWIFIQQFLVPAVLNADDGTSTVYSGDGGVTVFPTPSPSMDPSSSNPSCFPCIWQGISFFLQNLFIFISTLIFKFGRKEDTEAW